MSHSGHSHGKKGSGAVVRRFTEEQYGLCEYYCELRSQLVEFTIMVGLVLGAGFLYTIVELFKSINGTQEDKRGIKNSYKDFILMGAGLLVMLFFIGRLYWLLRKNSYWQIKNLRKPFRWLLGMYLGLMIWLNASQSWYKATISIIYGLQFLLISLFDYLFWWIHKITYHD